MIFKSFELNKINLTNVKFLLFYGLNEGAKEEAISSIIKKTNIKEIIRLEEKQILENNDLFFNEVLSKSLFNNEKLIIANRATDKIFDVFFAFLARQLFKWSEDDLKKLIYDLNEVELQIKKNIDNSLNLVTDFILNQSCSKS